MNKEQLDKFLKIKTYEEFDKRRHEFKRLKFTDPGVLEHLDEIMPKADPGIVDGCIIDAFIKESDLNK